jgi:TolA-binding protein
VTEDESPQEHPGHQRHDEREEHPEDILHRARQGLPLSAQERLIKREHLLRCDVCRLLEETRKELLDEAARPPAGTSISALVAATMTSFEAPSARPTAAATPPTRSKVRPRHPARMAAFAAAAICLLTGVALAARWLVEARTTSRVQQEPASSVTVPSMHVGLHPADGRGAQPAAHGEPGPAAQGAPLVEDAPGRRASLADDAATLFSRATAARRAGRVDEARRAYASLWRDFPDTVEARTGQVAYARWLLDRHQATPAAQAFADYLRSNPHGTLAAEARVGLAEALELGGDRAGARRAWQGVLDDPAARAFARHARGRLRALDTPARDGADGLRPP